MVCLAVVSVQRRFSRNSLSLRLFLVSLRKRCTLFLVSLLLFDSVLIFACRTSAYFVPFLVLAGHNYFCVCTFAFCWFFTCRFVRIRFVCVCFLFPVVFVAVVLFMLLRAIFRSVHCLSLIRRCCRLSVLSFIVLYVWMILHTIPGITMLVFSVSFFCSVDYLVTLLHPIDPVIGVVFSWLLTNNVFASVLFLLNFDVCSALFCFDAASICDNLLHMSSFFVSRRVYRTLSVPVLLPCVVLCIATCAGYCVAIIRLTCSSRVVVSVRLFVSLPVPFARLFYVFGPCDCVFAHNHVWFLFRSLISVFTCFSSLGSLSILFCLLRAFAAGLLLQSSHVSALVLVASRFL